MERASWAMLFGGQTRCIGCYSGFCRSSMRSVGKTDDRFRYPALLTALLMGLCPLSPAGAATRLKDLVSIEGVRENQLIGYGIVVGLNKTGDKQQTIFSTQSLANMLERMGVSVSSTSIKVSDTAAVMV